MPAPKQPRLRLVVQLEKYPSTLGTQIFRWSTTPLAAADFVEGRIPMDRWGELAFNLSAHDGHYDSSTFTFELADQDGMIAALMGADATAFFINREASVEILSTDAIVAGTEWRTLFAGRITDFQALDAMGYSGTITDYLGAELTGLSLDRPIARRLIGPEHFRCPTDMFGEMYPIVVGEHSDFGSVDADGNDASIGAVPLKFVGYAMLNADGSLAPPGSESMMAWMAPPTNLMATVVGATGTTTYTYSVSAIVSGYGETAMSQPIVVFNGPATFTSTNYIRLTWSDPPQYGEFITAWRIMGRSSFVTPTRHLRILSNDPVVHQYEDKGTDSEKLPIAPKVGTAQGQILINGVYASGWGKMLVGLGSIKITGFYGSDLGGSGDVSGESRGDAARVRIPMDHPDVICPYLDDGSVNPAWPFPDPWIETYGGIRATYIGVKGPILQDHLDGKVTMAVNCCGYTPSGGEYGEPAIPPLLETFDRPDFPIVDGLWDVATGGWTNPLGIASNQLAPPTNSFGGAQWAVQYGPDYQGYINLSDAPSVNGQYVSFEITLDSQVADSTPDGYAVRAGWVAGAGVISLIRLDDGSETVLVSQALAFTDGSWIGLWRDGTDLRVFHQPANGALTEIITHTDATYSGSWYTTIGIDETGGSVRVDSFGARTVPTEDGSIVDEPGQAAKLFLNEFVLKNAGEGYTSGPFGPLETFRSGVEILRTSTFDAFDVLNKTWIPGGYKAAWYIDDKTLTLRQFLQQFNETFGTYIGPCEYGQIGLFAVDDAYDPDDGNAYRQHIEVFDSHLPRASVDYPNMQTKRNYRFHWLPDRQDFRNPVEHVKDEVARQALKSPHRESPELGLRCSNDRATIEDTQARQLLRRKWPLVYQDFTTGLNGLEQPLGSVVRLFHRIGGGRGPYNAHPFFIMGKRYNLNTQRVTLSGWSLVRLIGLGTSDALFASDPTSTIAGDPGRTFEATDVFTDSVSEVFV